MFAHETLAGTDHCHPGEACWDHGDSVFDLVVAFFRASFGLLRLENANAFFISALTMLVIW